MNMFGTWPTGSSLHAVLEQQLTQYLGLDWLAMVLTFSAVYLLGNKSRNGFLIMIIANLCWAAVGAWSQSYAITVANFGFFAMNIRGFLAWLPDARESIEDKIAE
jgi:nicotinamide riboside transporter PnuC